MCGIAGVLDPGRATAGDELRSLAAAMAATLRHRGPDADGSWADPDGGVGLAMQRLAIVDLSPAGHQPMRSASGRWTIAFNGEVYDHRRLRSELEGRGHSFRGHSDTEVLLGAIDEWGLVPALERVNGMFALALWDGERRLLSLARDRLGEKPLYYGWAGGQFLFGSELKALRAHPAFAGGIDRGALALYLRLTYVPAPHSIHPGVRKLPPGTVLTVPGAAIAPGSLPEPQPWWRLADVAAAGAASRFTGSEDDAVDRLDELLRDSIGLRLQADVPVGAFLSGGVDSSAIVALAQAVSGGGRVRTFTVTMPEAGFDEGAEAAAVAAHLGTDHTAVELSPSAALGAVPRLAEVWDEPFADPSQLPTLLVAEVARREVTVALSGDGGDEVFGGYNRYVLGQSAWRWAGRAPRSVRVAAARPLLAVSPARWDAVARRLHPVTPERLRLRNAGDKAQRLAGLLRAGGPDDVYLALASHWDDPARLVGAAEPPTALDGMAALAGGGVVEGMMLADGLLALPDDMLVKVDRASMAVSLEARVPFLDPRVVELAWSLPVDMKVRDGQGKRVLRRLLHRYVPPALVDRPKMGFDPPLGAWLRGPLRPWAEDLLSSERLAADGWIDPAPVRACWDEHQAGRRNWDYRLWAVLMFQSWLDRW